MKRRRASDYRYLLKNISKNDINLGDLLYRIPAGQIRDLLGRTAHLDIKKIIKSREQGSIHVRLGKSLIEVDAIIIPKPPPMVEADPSAITFPQRVKSCITIEVGDISEDIDNIAISEDEEFLKQMEDEQLQTGDDSVPIIAKDDEGVKT